MDAAQRYCLGCQRTLEEIARWSQMSDAERAAVLATLAKRRLGKLIRPGARA